MRRLSFFLIAFAIGLIAWRTWQWKSARERALDFCAHFHGSRFDPGPFVAVTGEVTAFADPMKAPQLTRVQFQAAALSAHVGLPLERAVPNFGARVRISARFKCFLPLRNPGEQSDPFLQFEPVRLQALPRGFSFTVLPEANHWAARVAEWGSTTLVAPARAWPGVTSLLLSIWTGDSSRLPTSLKSLYRDGGLLQLLALSGQHAVAAALLLRALWDLSLGHLPFTWTRRLAPHMRPLFPLITAGLLWVLSRGMPSMARTLAMAAAVLCLRRRALPVRTAHVLSVSLGLLILLDPTQLGSRGLVLSAVATYFCVKQFEWSARPRPLVQYLWMSLAMPALLWPFQVWYFCRLSLVASVYTLLQGWLWDLVILPWGFTLPFWLRLPVVGELVGGFSEVAFWKFVGWNERLAVWVPPYQPVVVRLNSWEVGACAVLLVSLLRALEKRAFPGVGRDGGLK